jgi:hypothetical protein
MPIILATWDAEIRRLAEAKNQDPTSKILNRKKVAG